MRGRDIEVDGLLNVVRRRLQERARCRSADITDNDVQPPERIARLGHKTRRLPQVSQVSHHHTGTTPRRFYGLGSHLKLPRRARGDNYVSAGLSQRDRRRRADPASRTSDDRHPAIHPELIRQHHPTTSLTGAAAVGYHQSRHSRSRSVSQAASAMARRVVLSASPRMVRGRPGEPDG